MNPLSLLAILTLSLAAEDHRKLLFEDNFERNEASEEKEDLGNGWTTASDKRAQGNKQVDLKDGAMHIFIHEVADHAVSVRHEAGFQDGAVESRFMLEDPKDQLGFNFADMDCKEVHAGHLFKVVISNKRIAITDLKTGIMNLAIREKRKSNNLTPEETKALKSKSKAFPIEVEIGEWHAIAITIKGDTATLSLNDKELGSFSSPGFAHPTKGLLRLSVPRQAIVDDLKIFAAS